MSADLLTAARGGEFKKVEELIRLGADVNHQDEKGRTALFAAAENGHIEIVKLLLEHKADITHQAKEGRTALFAAAKNGHIETVKLLLEHKADINHQSKEGQTAFHTAALNGHIEAVKLLLEHKADINHQAKEGWTALFVAAQNGHIEIVKLLLERKAYINIQNKDGWTALFFAAAGGHIEIVKLLLEHKADINHQAKEGWTALFAPAQDGHIEIVKLLLERKAYINIQDKDGWTALFVAAQNGHIEIIKLLLERKADINHQAKEGWTALHLAAHSGHIAIARHLLSHGAFINSVLSNGASPRQIIQSSSKHPDILNLLINAENLISLATQNKDAKELIEILKRLGPSINARRVEDGNSALSFFIQHKNKGSVEALLDAGADISLQNKQELSALGLARQVNEPYILLLILIKSIKQIFNEIEDEKSKDNNNKHGLEKDSLMSLESMENIESKEGKETKEANEKLENLTKQISQTIKEALEVLNKIDGLDKEILSFRLGMLLASPTPESSPLEPVVAYNLLQLVSEKVGLECFQKANHALFKLLIGKHVKLQYQEGDGLDSDKKVVAMPGNGLAPHGSEGRELRLKYEIKYSLNAGSESEIDNGKLIAEYMFGSEASMPGIPGFTGANTNSILSLIEKVRQKIKPPIESDIEMESETLHNIERSGKAEKEEQKPKEPAAVEEVNLSIEVDTVEKSEAPSKKPLSHGALTRDEELEDVQRIEEREDAKQRIAQSQKAAEEMRLLIPIGHLSQASRNTKRSATQAELQTPEMSLGTSKSKRSLKERKPVIESTRQRFI